MSSEKAKWFVNIYLYIICIYACLFAVVCFIQYKRRKTNLKKKKENFLVTKTTKDRDKDKVCCCSETISCTFAHLSQFFLHCILLRPLSSGLKRKIPIIQIDFAFHGSYRIVFLLVRLVCSSNVWHQWILEGNVQLGMRRKIVDFVFTSGLGSQSNEQIESNTFEMVNAGDHCDRKMSKQIAPFELIFGWKIFVVNLNEFEWRVKRELSEKSPLRDLWRFERIIGREMNGEKEDAALKWTITRTHYRCLP